SNTEFYALNISNPQGSIAILGSVEINEDVTDIYVKDGYAYVATDDGSASQTGNEIRRINLSTYMVEDTGNLSDSAEAFAVWFQGSHIYAGTDSTSSEIQVLQSGGESGWDVPRIVETVDLPGSNDMNDIIISGDYAFAGRDTTAGQPEFIVFNISDPFNVTVAGSLEVGSDVNDLYMMGNYVYIATSDNNAEFQIINVTNKTAPTLTGIYNTSRTKDGLSVTGSGSVAYLGTEQDSGQTNNELFLINVSTLSSPTLYSSLEVGSNVIDLSNGSENLFIGTASPNQEVRTVDIANPATPSIVYTYNVTGSRIVNGILYDSSSKELHVTMTASGNNPNYVIFDVSNEVNFIELGGVVTTGDYNMHTLFVGFAGRTFVIAVTNDTGAEFKVIDTTVVESPFVRSSLDIGGDGMGVATTGSYMFVVGTADSQELIVITWGAPEVPEYARFGIYTSEEFSSDSDTTAWNTITWEQSGTGVIWFQTRTASSTGGTALATWMGPNGPGTYYSSTGSTIAISGDATGTRFMQFAAYLYGSGSATPILDSVTLDYSM
ncbi:hypothetical protein KKC94_03325, partial [Patescibacteria group bacterium]|nr:hypothetical protein [Patescibacteria group bacterium]